MIFYKKNNNTQIASFTEAQHISTYNPKNCLDSRSS
jgi:hypothetical protein